MNAVMLHCLSQICAWPRQDCSLRRSAKARAKAKLLMMACKASLKTPWDNRRLASHTGKLWQPILCMMKAPPKTSESQSKSFRKLKVARFMLRTPSILQIGKKDYIDSSHKGLMPVAGVGSEEIVLGA